MADKFVIAHAGAKKAEARANDIFAIRQTPGEGLRDFLARFNRVRKSLPNMSEGMAVAAFQNGNPQCLLHRGKADEDDLNGPIQRLTSVQTEARKDRRNDDRREQLPRLSRERHQPYIRAPIPPPPRHTDVPTRHTAPHRNERVYALEKLGAMAAKDRKSDPSTQKSNVLCEFHQERGHKIEDCIGLRQEVVRMLNQGHLKELLSDRGRANFARGREQPQGPPKPPSPARTIQMIIGGGDDTTFNHVKFTTTHKFKRSITHERYDDLEDSIIFDKPDTDGLCFPHYYALVITLRIADTDVKRIMVDDESGACIIHPRVLVQMRLDDKIILHCIILTGFNNAIERTSGEIVLPVLAGGVTLEMTFHVMDQDTTYNAIIGRPWIHAMRALPSSLYQIDAIKDPDIIEASESTIEDLDPVQLDNNDITKKAYIGHNLSERDMSGIPKDIATHKLNVDPLCPPLQQMRRKFNAAINDAVSEEVDKLLANGSVRKSKYPQWVANVLIDATAGHELLSFLDAYSSYNHILMEEEDQEKTTFITHQGT
ncbi:PREDICTED: uncharacterized protein LOC109238286 [Nicotiana attenuata]|uniref:uncharacterized protein LOC109238286 n=1 Tax=Nicotiana attenuata TaxID=49451 RepID=UPI000904F2AE|nr:PREDICTED: uncharacterized protein LOC109238286 [Nicotiana attenuata]